MKYPHTRTNLASVFRRALSRIRDFRVVRMPLLPHKNGYFSQHTKIFARSCYKNKPGN